MAGEADGEGFLTLLSVNCASVADLDELARYLPHNKLAGTTVGAVRAVGGEVMPSPTWNNPYHCDLSGTNAEQTSRLFSEILDNPIPMSSRMPLGR